jgi:ketosteroid isomerase-like protein
VTEVVERYLKALIAHDWEAFAACLADEVVRVGPFGDTYSPKAPYVDYISKLMPSLQGYAMEIERVIDAGPAVVVELSETVEIGGETIVTPETLVFDLDVDGLIQKIDIYIKRLST